MNACGVGSWRQCTDGEIPKNIAQYAVMVPSVVRHFLLCCGNSEIELLKCSIWFRQYKKKMAVETGKSVQEPFQWKQSGLDQKPFRDKSIHCHEEFSVGTVEKMKWLKGLIITPQIALNASFRRTHEVGSQGRGQNQHSINYCNITNKKTWWLA